MTARASHVTGPFFVIVQPRRELLPRAPEHFGVVDTVLEQLEVLVAYVERDVV